jgi:outer membrane lipoprotein LolB
MRILLCVYLSLLLTGCYRPHPHSPGNTPLWCYQGKIALVTPEYGRHLRFEWQHFAHENMLRFSGPLGYPHATLHQTPTLTQLFRSEGPTLTADSPEALLHTHLNIALPLAGLEYWIQGLPIPQAPLSQVKKNRQGQYTDFIQDGWTVQYREAPGYLRKIILKHDDIRLTLLALPTFPQRNGE